jgi:stearoyl-CoA desaturase (Delta-9 desaturase)
MSAIERRITVTAVVLPFVGFCVAVVLLWGGLVTALDLGIFATMYAAAGLGVTVGFHRLLTHRSFEAPTWVRSLLAILGSMSIQGAVIHWVADHRKHHTYADEDGDPHSPHTEPGSGFLGVIRGIWHSHLGWLFDRKDRASARRYAPDLRSDRAISFVDRWFVAWILLGLAIPAIAGFALSGGSLKAAATALLWGGFVRVFFLHHATWSVNSICHLYGRRPFALEDESRNNWAIALLSFGEGWHHNHHAFPTSARHGLRRLQFDPTYAVIKLLELVGLARNVRRPNKKQIASKLRTPEQLTPSESPAETGFAKASQGS